MSINYQKHRFCFQFVCPQPKKAILLHRVFHSIRFKVNKGWVTAVTLFLCLNEKNVAFFFLRIKFFCIFAVRKILITLQR